MENTFNIKVPENIKLEQEKQITMLDLEKAIKTMKNGKTPGEDGIPVDFYKVFWTRIRIAFYDMVIQCYEYTKLHDTARKGILNLIPKPGKDSRYIKNLRPITLLNTDYKIIEKAIANKMLPALETLINQDQRGFMKERRISVNIRKMLDIIHQANKEDIEAVVLSLDFVKCFDKCSFSILHGSLDFFGFGQIVKEWTKILYKEYTVKIQNNGYFSDTIPIDKGVHQGGCCSSIYFLVIAEILALSLRNNGDIEGLTIQDIRNLLNQFADDMDIFSSNSERSLKAIFHELDSFKSQSGFTISYEKTTLYRIGSLRHSSAQLYNMSQVAWSNQDITVLGVTIAHDDLVQKNYKGIILKAEKVLSAWQNRGLSLIGKIQVINTLVASLFVYKMMVLPLIPCNIVKQMENLFRNYIWGGKKSKIALNILQNSKSEGDLNLVNLKKRNMALKATWPKILHYEDQYAQLVYGIMGCSKLKDDIWRCNLNQEDVQKVGITDPFWRDVVKCWSEYNVYQEFRIENQIIWYNSNIKIAKQPFIWGDAYSKGLIFVHQLFDNKSFKTFRQLSEEFGLNWMNCRNLIVAIPKESKNFFLLHTKQEIFPLPPTTYDKVISGLEQHLSRKVYKFLLDDAMLIHNKYIKWRIELGQSICEDLRDFTRVHQDIYRVTNVPKF